MQHSDELGRLVDLVGALRTNRSHNGYQAVVFEDSSEDGGVHREYQVTAKTHEGIYELAYSERSGTSEMTYIPSQKMLVIKDFGQNPIHIDGQDVFPTVPPVFAMFNPLELPIWGGDRDGQRVLSTSTEEGDSIRLNFASKEDPSNLRTMGYAIVDVPRCVVTELYYNDHRFTVEKISEIPPLDMD